MKLLSRITIVLMDHQTIAVGKKTLEQAGLLLSPEENVSLCSGHVSHSTRL